MRARGRAFRAAALLALAAARCADGRSTGPSEVVAVLDGRSVTVAEIDAHIASILDQEAMDEPLHAEQLDRVKSRLFDDFLDEELLLLEAQRRGIEVPEQEVNNHLAGQEQASPPPDPVSRQRVRRSLMIAKLRSEVIGEVGVDESEVEAYVEAHRADLAPEPGLRLRSLTLDDLQQAYRVRREIVRDGRSLSEETVEIGLEELPAEIREAVEQLPPGETSAPVEYEGRVYLFQVEASDSEGGMPGLRERARWELRRLKAEQAGQRLLEELRTASHVEVRKENLPFRYVAEEDRGADPARPGAGG
jgi:hypothetical protein